eukprot:1848658-Lingulodinium_polyedra.AAC.1
MQHGHQFYGIYGNGWIQRSIWSSKTKPHSWTPPASVGVAVHWRLCHVSTYPPDLSNTNANQILRLGPGATCGGALPGATTDATVMPGRAHTGLSWRTRCCGATSP